MFTVTHLEKQAVCLFCVCLFILAFIFYQYSVLNTHFYEMDLKYCRPCASEYTHTHTHTHTQTQTREKKETIRELSFLNNLTQYENRIRPMGCYHFSQWETGDMGQMVAKEMVIFHLPTIMMLSSCILKIYYLTL